jgi:glycosyltransferase involved in cell wall biosynthesis
MRRSRELKILFYVNVVIIVFLVGYKLYLNFVEENYGAVHAVQMERIERCLKGRSCFSFTVVGNVKNSIGIFEKKIVPLLNSSETDFVVSAGNAVSGGGEDKYRALHSTMEKLGIPYMLTFGEDEESAFGGGRFYEHYGPYLFTFVAGNSRFVFLDGTGKTSWDWQFRWFEDLMAGSSEERVFVFVGRPPIPVNTVGLVGVSSKSFLDQDVGQKLVSMFSRFGVDVVFSANLPFFDETFCDGVKYIITGGSGGLVLNDDLSFYHYVQVKVDENGISIEPIRLDIGQHPFFRTLESLWFFVHSLFYVGYVNFLLMVCMCAAVAIWLYSVVFVEKNYYPDFDSPSDPMLDRPIGVAMFTNTFFPFIGGVPVSVDRLRRALSSLGHRVIVVAPGGGKSEEGVLGVPPLLRGVKVFGVAVSNIFLPRIYRSVSGFKPDVIHVHHPYWLGSVGLFIAGRMGVPVVYTYHTRLDRFDHAVPIPGALFRNFISHAMVRHFCNKCDGVVVPTESAEYYLRMIGVRRPLFVLPTGIDRELFFRVNRAQVEELREKLGLGEEKILITISRLSKEKNILFMLDALASLRDICDVPFKFLIVGDGPDREEVETAISDLRLDDTVVLVGAVSPENIPVYYGLGDLFVFASCSETQGMVVLEALTMGLPVVAVRSSGVDDFIKDGINGYKTLLDRASWSDRIRTLIEDPDLSKRISENAEALARKYGMEEFGRSMEKVYARLLNKKVERE